MAEQMDAIRDQGESSKDNDAQKPQQPKAENAQPKGGGLRNAISKNKKVGENVATQASAAPEGKALATRGGDKKEEAQTRTKEKGDKKAAKGKEGKNPEAEEEEKEEEGSESAEVEALEGEEELAPNKISWQELKAMLNDGEAMGNGDMKTQINPTFFTTVCPASVAEKGSMINLLKSIQAQSLVYNTNKAFEGKQAALQNMISNSNDLMTMLNTVLAGEGIKDDNQRKALQQYAQSLQGFVQTVQSKLQYNQEVWGFYANNELNLDAALFQDKDFHAAFANFATQEKDLNTLSAYMQAKKGDAPKKILFKTLYKGVKSNDKAVNEMLYKEKLRTGKKLQVDLPAPMVAGLWSNYKTKKLGKFKSTLKKEAAPMLFEQVQGLYNKFMASNITGDKI